MLFFNFYRSKTIVGDTTPNPLLPSSSSLFLHFSLHHPNLHQQWQRRPNEWSHCKMKNLKEESGIFDLSWYISSKRANQKLEVDPSMENEEALGTDGMDGFLSNLANAILGIDEAMSFAEMLKWMVTYVKLFNFLKKEMLMLSSVMSMTLMSSGFERIGLKNIWTSKR
ncbi:uncharacterized protein LOC114302556 isoform X2 [Camellia sinensis]|uniref:uncharacterized protein LOC114302556 isoform X2 n=1 Tax=Camellia sinensis TaxID=4442 RepID=UPI0010358D13|nr:uncharacterized protein LOC114302556 isoform X2 [Camellia sinensis]